jgi:hypothetical protein
VADGILVVHLVAAGVVQAALVEFDDAADAALLDQPLDAPAGQRIALRVFHGGDQDVLRLDRVGVLCGGHLKRGRLGVEVRVVAPFHGLRVLALNMAAVKHSEPGRRRTATGCQTHDQ